METNRKTLLPKLLLSPIADEEPTITDKAMEDSQAAPVMFDAKLTKWQRMLHDLWKEYKFELSGLKPTKDWTIAERGR